MSLNAVKAERIRDTAGAGDWCTAGIIDGLFRSGAASLDSLTDRQVNKAIRFGQAASAWACGFEGARGGMYEVDFQSFLTSVAGFVGEDAHRFADRRSGPSLSAPCAFQSRTLCICGLRLDGRTG